MTYSSSTELDTPERLRELLWRIPSDIHRDLAWLIGSHSLFRPTSRVPCVCSQTFQKMLEGSVDWLLSDANHPERLLKWIDTPRKYKLGLYAEDLLLYYLLHGSQYQLLAHDKQIFREGSCIGAVDFIVRTPSGEVEHWEMAMKYFVQYEESSDWVDFIGPSGRDTLQRKMEKMLDRQLLLSSTPEAIALFTEQQIPLPNTQKIISLGLFFHHIDRNFIPPVSGEENQPTGWWCRKKRFFHYAERESSLWKVLPHPRWLAPVLTRSNSDLLTVGVLYDTLQDIESYVMLAELKKGKRGWQEIKRWVVMPDCWEKKEDSSGAFRRQYP